MVAWQLGPVSGIQYWEGLAFDTVCPYIRFVDISADRSVPRDTLAFADVYPQNFDTTDPAF
jgi:hypothetical protein